MSGRDPTTTTNILKQGLETPDFTIHFHSWNYDDAIVSNQTNNFSK